MVEILIVFFIAIFALMIAFWYEKKHTIGEDNFR